MSSRSTMNTISTISRALPQRESHILIVDDDVFSLRIHAHMLESVGRENVKCFASARQALEFVDENPFSINLILLDINMPEMDGIEFVRHLVKRTFQGATVLISGENVRLVNSVVTLGREHGLAMLGRVTKPLCIDHLHSVLALWDDVCAKPSGSVAKHSYDTGELREAISCGDLVNYYQPQVCLKDGAFLGVETLVRWVHAEHGVVPPIEFISLAEECGLIDDLARDVLAGSLLDARLWDAIGLRPRIAINLSAENLRDPQLTDYIVSACESAGLEPRRLVLEVTESGLFRKRPAALDILARLGLKRFGLSIDDFGTGYASLSQLQDVSFSELKIDRRFVHGAVNDTTRRAFFDASLDLALSLDMTTVAEGVEDKEDWSFVRDSGCHVAQGYFVGRPMPAGDLPKWLAEWTIRRPLLFPG